MKLFFLPAKSKTDIKSTIEKIDLSKLNGKIGLVTTVQYLDQVKKYQSLIPHSIFAGQILGCNVSQPYSILKQVDCFLYIGSGDFHPIELLKLKKPVFVLNPETQKFKELDQKVLTDYEKSVRGKQLKFLNANKIGILISLKPHQKNLKVALELKKKLGDKAYLFLCSNFSDFEAENFREMDIFVNTACPRIDSKNIINLVDLPK
ncbi:MAG: diphthamide synthesis protein [Candidatus Woesearchaeota archaeon]|nr:MAG: diphthamide synthesis protein [Candidatus Woesearchaeota archaeon]